MSVGDEDHPEDQFTAWLYRHPWTLGYIAVVTTLILIVNTISLLTS